MNFNSYKIWLREKIKGDPILSLFVLLVSDSAVYLVGAALLGLGNFVLVPIYTHQLNPTQFGIYSIIDITILFLVAAAQLGFAVAYLKKYSEEGEAGRGELIGTVIGISSSVALVCGSILVLIVDSPIGQKWLQTTDLNFAWMLLPIIVLENAQGLLLSDLRARRKPVSYSSATIARLVTIVLSSMWFIIVQKMGLSGVFLGRLVGDATSVLILSFACLTSVRLRISLPLARTMVKYGSPLVWSSLVAMLLDASGRYFLGQFSSIEQVGYYGASIKISSIFQTLLVQPFGIAWGGLMFQIVKWPNAQKIYSKIFEYLYIISLTIALLITIFTPTIFGLFATKTYNQAMAVFPLILFVRAINILEYPSSIGLYLKGKTSMFPIIYTIGLITNIAINLLITPKLGMFGSAGAWLVGWLTIIILMTVIGQRYYPLRYNLKSIIIPPVIWSIALFVLSTHNFNSDLGGWSIRILLAFITVAAAGLLLWSDFRKNHQSVHYGEIIT